MIMKSVYLLPSQIITLNDFPLHDEHVLKIYFRIYEKNAGKIIPPVPVMHKDYVVPCFSEKLKKVFNDFHKNNPGADYFMLDGSHRTTAAALSKCRIKAIILSNETDVKEAERLVKTGELFHFYLEKTIDGIIKELVNHFRKKMFFQTVEQKTRMMISKKHVPNYMINCRI